jgi:2-desacetyl-2-hydroxyethyl bacteriochlorophyllide A dehydrogenase
MRALVQEGPGDVRLTELPLPEPAKGQVLVRVRANGICGSDLHFWRFAPFGPGVVLGHEIAGEVAALGDGVEGLSVGELGAVYAGGPCGSCDRCKAGLAHYCEQGIALGTGRGIGGLAEYLVAPAANFLRMPPGTDPAAITFSEPLANGIRCMDHPEVPGARSALVLGAGAIGLSCLIVLKRAGVQHVWAVEGRPQRRQAALALGADRTLHPVDDDVETEVRREFPHGLELVVEAAGLAETITSSMKLMRPGGSVFVIGVCFGDVAVQPVQWLLKEITIHASLGCSREDQVTATEMIAKGELDPAPLVTRRVPLAEVPEMLVALEKGADEVKVVVEHDRV